MLALPVNAIVWSLGFSEVRVAGSLRGAIGVHVNLPRWVEARTQPVGALLLDTATDDGTAVASLPVLWVPGEPTQAVGRAWRAAWGDDGKGTPPLLIGLANGSAGYIVSRDEYLAGGYEATATLYGPSTAALLGEGLHAVRRALLAPKPD